MDDKYISKEEFLKVAVTKDECKEYRKQIAEQMLKQERKNEDQDKLLNDLDKTSVLFMQKVNLICNILYAIGGVILTGVISSILNLIFK